VGDSREFLVVEAINNNRTYIGASFCRDEEALQAACDIADPLDVLEVNEARRAVQQGATVHETLQGYDFREKVSGKRLFKPVVQHCLQRIEAGKCAVYPKDS
jgi:hypothetical protein